MDENTIPEPSLEESIKILLMQVPLAVRNFVLNDLGTKTQELMTRYQLHIDQGNILERELLLMLLGQEEPAEFVSTLQGIGIDSQIVQSLTNDINTEVFMKLRASEEKSPDAMAPVSQKLIEQSPSVPQLPRPEAVSAPVSMPLPQQFVPPAPQAPQPTDIHDVRTMASDIALVKSGAFKERREAVFVPASPVPRSVARVPIPASIVNPSPQPVSSAPPIPPSQPMQQMPPQVALPPAMPKAPAPQSENREALHDILKQYGVDPYREPSE